LQIFLKVFSRQNSSLITTWHSERPFFTEISFWSSSECERRSTDVEHVIPNDSE